MGTMVSGGHASSAAVVASNVTFTFIAACLTVLRLYTRRYRSNNLGPDDVMGAIGLSLSVALTFTACEQVLYGLGRHQDTLDSSQSTASRQWLWASMWIFSLGIWAAQMSVLFQYFRVVSLPYRRVSFAFMGISSAWALWTFVSAVFACIPVVSFWDSSVSGTCWTSSVVWIINSVVNILINCGITLLGIPALRTLPIAKHQKNLLMCVVALGGLVCFFSILHLQSLYAISVSNDASWDSPLAATWSSLQVNLGLICSCVVPLKDLVSKNFGSCAGYLRSDGDELLKSTRQDYRLTLGQYAPNAEKGNVTFEITEFTQPAPAPAPTAAAAVPVPAPAPAPAASRKSTRVSYSPFLTQHEIALEEKRRSLGFKRFSLARKEAAPPIPELDPTILPTLNLIAEEDEARSKVRSYVMGRPKDFGREGSESRKGSASTVASEFPKKSMDV